MDDRAEIRELLAAWALDAVDDDERARVERAIHDDPELAREAHAMVETASRLADEAAAPPPEELRRQVLLSLDSTRRRPAVRFTSHPSWSMTVQLGTFGWIVVAAVATIAVLAPAVLAIQQAGRAARAEAAVATYVELLSHTGSRVVTGQVTGGGHAVAVLGNSESVFAAADLPSLGRGLDYQLWVLDEDAAVSAGVLEIGNGAVPIVVDAGVNDTLALTVEPTGGSGQPTTDPVITLPEPEPSPEGEAESEAAA